MLEDVCCRSRNAKILYDFARSGQRAERSHRIAGNLCRDGIHVLVLLLDSSTQCLDVGHNFCVGLARFDEHAFDFL